MSGGFAYYNEIDPYAARWLVNLIGAGLIAPGVVDQRSISDVTPNDLRGFTQCHFFAGIGVWSHALRRAGWSDDMPVWTGSCPCQPFSAAGKGAGVDDERHLWPHWHHLIRECRPERVLVEQVASRDGLGWLDLVSTDLEAEGYAFAAADLCAAGFAVGQGWEGDEWLQRAILSCPDPVVAEQLRDFAGWAGANLGNGGNHLRQRLYGYAERVAQPDSGECNGRANASGGHQCIRADTGWSQGDGSVASGGTVGSMAHTPHSGQSGWSGTSGSDGTQVVHDSESGRLAHTDGGNAGAQWQQRSGEHGQQPSHGGASVGLAHAFSARRGQVGCDPASDRETPAGRSRNRDSDGSADVQRSRLDDTPRPDAGQREWLLCNDPDGPRWRPVEPGTFPLADAAPARVGRLRAYGNGLDAETATRFVEAVMSL